MIEYLERRVLSMPSSATSEGWDAWEAKQKSERPFAFWAIHDVPMWFGRLWGRARDAYWWIRHRTTNRYDRIKIRGLTPGYYDADTRMLYGCFTLLQDYVERECGGLEGLRAWTKELEGDPACGWQEEKQRECDALYVWWTRERPRRPDPTDLWVAGGETREALHESHVEEERQNAEDEEMLHRLIRIRRGLWT